MQIELGQIYKLTRDGNKDFVVFTSPYYCFSIISQTSYGGIMKTDKLEDTGKSLKDIINFIQ